ncbi:MAG: FtsK/SpoIIIE domain-containing protein [Pseudomonadota bacterium]
MIDPKMLELTPYSPIPHLLMPVITSPKKAELALQWCLKEMKRRYELMQKHSTRNIKNFNSKVEHNTISNVKKLPYIIIIIDEFADLILNSKIETFIQQIAQMARAAGMHMVIGTQRPSSDVITGVIKANIPSRICLNVSSQIDSNIALGEPGGEKLLGKGDLLFKQPGETTERILGPFVSEEDIEKITSQLADIQVTEHKIDLSSSMNNTHFDNEKNNELLQEVYQYFLKKYKETNKNNISISETQRKFNIGFNKAASIIEMMEEKKLITPPLNDQGKRQLIIN